jgi:hypothetical protein
MTLSLKNEVNVPVFRIRVCFWASWTASGSVSQRYGPEGPDPDPYQNVTDPQHWKNAGLGNVLTQPKCAILSVSPYFRTAPLVCVCVCRTGVLAVGAAPGGFQGAAGPPGHGERGRQVGPQPEIWPTPHTRYRQANMLALLLLLGVSGLGCINAKVAFKQGEKY